MSRATIDHLLVDTCTVYTTSTPNKFGEPSKSGGKDYNCRFREINHVDSNSMRLEVNADAMLWLPAGTPVELQMPVDYHGDHYRIVQITQARRGGEVDPQFVKCLVERLQ